MLLLFSASVFIGAFLMFSLEPLVAKILLPRLGGAPMVWNTCVVFFQATLMAGYGFSHAMARMRSTWRGMFIYGVVMLSASLAPTFAFSANAPTQGSPLLWLLAELTRSVGAVFFVLAVSGPTLGTWFSMSRHHKARNPYFLYAASNLGSFCALLLYPTVVEPQLTVRAQARIWSAGYLIFVCAVLACGFIVWFGRAGATSASHESAATERATIRSSERLAWFALAFVPSSLMLGVTTYISTDVAAVPLVWIVPLALYLATLVLAFGSGGALIRVAERRMALLTTAVVFLFTANIALPVAYNIPLHLLTFFVLALACHGLLAARRPPVSRLTEFYLWVAGGGVAGGLFNVLAAPLLFSGIAEYPLLLVCAAAMPILRTGAASKRSLNLRDVSLAVALGAFTWASFVTFERWLGGPGPGLVVVIGLAAVLAFAQSRRPMRFGLALGSMLLASSLSGSLYGRVLYAQRTFFGVYHVSASADGGFRSLFHGTTLHGMQSTDPAQASEPLTYYHRRGPFGQVFDLLPGMRTAPAIAVVGLGVGSLAAYAQPNQQWTFFEIDPAVERIARDAQFFTYLEACGARCRVLIGDARLALAAQSARYDVIVLDAFSSDAIPVHLLTKEAFALYLERLAPDGVLMFHISNRYLDLSDVLARLAASRQMAALEQLQIVGPNPANRGQTDSDWVVMSQRGERFEGLRNDGRWKTLTASDPAPQWTDDFSNILSVMRFRRKR